MYEETLMMIFKGANMPVNPYIKTVCSKTYIWCDNMLFYMIQYQKIRMLHKGTK
jgi:hypothetical protein